MRQFIGIVIFVPLAVIIGIFAVENRASLALEIWPLPGPHEMWASVWILGLLAIGLILGMSVGWLAGIGWRRRARRAERLYRTLERQIAERDAAPITVVANTPAAGALPAPAGRAARTALLED
jgi:putative membrane protein